MNGHVELVGSVPDAFARLVLEAFAGPGGPGHNDTRFSLFLSGGSTAEECYRRLAELSGADPGVGWRDVDVYLGDERCVPPDHADSNHRMVAEVLLDAVGPVASDNPMYRTGPAAEAAAAYQHIISRLPHFDLVHLGLGPDGHTASLFPHSPALAVEDPEVLVVANRDPDQHNPHDRITLTLPAIARARLAVFTVSGASKREALRRIVNGEDLPAGRVEAQRVVWLVDAGAAGDIRLPT